MSVMTRVSGRNIFIVDLASVLNATGGAKAFAGRCHASKFTAIWVRLARGSTLDSNFSLKTLPDVQTALANVNVALWGWHVPFCADQEAAKSEGDNVVNWANTFSLAGVVIDAECTPEDPRFQGTEDEAKTYLGLVQPGLSAKGRGIALSSHDEPLGHDNFPFAVFLSYVADGFLVTTPAGSTAYNLSLRGPIVSPKISAIVLTPIAAHMLFDRSLVVAPDEEVGIELLADRPAVLVVDGRSSIALEPGDSISVRGGQRPARFVTFETGDFYGVLRAKFGLSDR